MVVAASDQQWFAVVDASGSELSQSSVRMVVRVVGDVLCLCYLNRSYQCVRRCRVCATPVTPRHKARAAVGRFRGEGWGISTSIAQTKNIKKNDQNINILFLAFTVCDGTRQYATVRDGTRRYATVRDGSRR